MGWHGWDFEGLHIIWSNDPLFFQCVTVRIGVGLRFVPVVTLYWMTWYFTDITPWDVVPVYSVSQLRSWLLWVHYHQKPNYSRMCHRDQNKLTQFILCFETCTNPFIVSNYFSKRLYSFTVCHVLYITQPSTSFSYFHCSHISWGLWNTGLFPWCTVLNHNPHVSAKLSCTHFCTVSDSASTFGNLYTLYTISKSWLLVTIRPSTHNRLWPLPTAAHTMYHSMFLQQTSDNEYQTSITM